MGIEDFIKDALHKPNDYIAYHVGRQLAELHPDKSILHGQTGYFDLEAFVRAEKCSIVAESSVFNHISTDWEGAGKGLIPKFENSWLNVLWRGLLLDVVLITWADRYPIRHHWIMAETMDVVEAFFNEVCEWSSEVHGELLVFQDGDWEKDKELYEGIKTATFENLVLPVALKRQIQNDFAQFFGSREIYERYRIPWKRGVLFIGPPGNGKTHTLKALINQLGRPCLYVKAFRSEYGTDQENIRAVFERARRAAPCLLVFEDLDSMVDNKNRSSFLNELDGFETNTGVVVLGTTNYPERLDPAILNRPSRFDRKYYFELPGEVERSLYVAAWEKELQGDLRLSEEVVREVVQLTEGFSFAYMKELFLSSMMLWMSSVARSAESGDASLGEIILAQASQLREQMAAPSKAACGPDS